MLTAAAMGLPRRDAPRAGEPRPKSLTDYYRIPAVVRWSFIAFVGSMPIEALSLPFLNMAGFSLARLSGLLFVASFLFFYNPISGKRSFPSTSNALSCFLVYFSVFLANGLFLDGHYLQQFVSIAGTLAQLLLFFWICSSLLRVETLAQHALLAFASVAAASAIATLLQFPGFGAVIESRAGERITTLEFNPNYLALMMGIAAIILIGTALENRAMSPWLRGCFLVTVMPLLALLVLTGSRTGLAAFAVGFGAYLLPGRQSRPRRLVFLISFLVIATLAYLVMNHQTVLTRFEQSYAGNLAGRQNIIPAAVDMILEQPIFGWRPVAYWEELARRIGQIWGVRDAHNLMIHVLLEVGLLGAVPFAAGLWVCLAGSWKARSGKFGNLPFALVVAIVTANLSHTYLAHKAQWLILAFAVAVAATGAKRAPAARYLIRHRLRSDGHAARPVYPAPIRTRQF